MSATGDRRPGSGSDSGETLLETLVVVAIVALVSTVGFPQLRQSLAAFSARQTVATVAEQLRRARAEALRRDSAVVFAVSADGRTYGTLGDRRRATPAGVALYSREATRGGIVFHGDGSSAGGSVRVTAGRMRVVVAVSPGTGAVALTRS